MNFEELNLRDRVVLHVLPSLMATDMRKSMSHKTLVHEARQLADAFIDSLDKAAYKKPAERVLEREWA